MQGPEGVPMSIRRGPGCMLAERLGCLGGFSGGPGTAATAGPHWYLPLRTCFISGGD